MRLIVTIALGFVAGQIFWELFLWPRGGQDRRACGRLRLCSAEFSKRRGSSDAWKCRNDFRELVGESRASLRSRLDSPAPDGLVGPVGLPVSRV